MYNEGDIIRSVDLVDPTSGRLSQLFRKVKHMMVRSTSAEVMFEDHLILLPLLKVCICLLITKKRELIIPLAKKLITHVSNHKLEVWVSSKLVSPLTSQMLSLLGKKGISNAKFNI